MAFLQPEATALTEADFTTKLERFIAGVNKTMADAQLCRPTVIRLRSGRGKTLALDVIEFDDAEMTSDGTARSVFCFIAAEDNTTKALGTVTKGDVLRAAGYKRPAKHARGNIYDRAGGLGGRSTNHPIAWTGPEYLR